MSKLNVIDEIRYISQQKFLHSNLDNIQAIGRLFLPKERKIIPTKQEIKILNERFKKLLENDIKNVKENMYPKSLLFQIPFDFYIKMFPGLAVEIQRMFHKLKKNTYKSLPEYVSENDYPNYFLRNFHWQTDGYFSENSAKLYDIGVELLFLGTADIMRRQIIPVITNFLNNKEEENIKQLDVATGTGRFIKQLKTAHKDLKITSIDLSPYYTEFAKKSLSNFSKIEFLQANAEQIPFENETFDIISCVYLFHELPRNVRKKVISEIYRTLKPGGLFVLQDSIQLTDSGELKNVILRFEKEFHEPYYKDYIQLDLGELLEEIGFKNIKTDINYVAKTVYGYKI